MRDIDYTEMGFWVGLGQWLFNLLVALYLLVTRKHTAIHTKVEEISTSLSQRVSETEMAIVRICSDVSHMPNKNDITALTKELADVKGRLGGINRAVDLINEFLLNQGAKK